MILMFKNSKLKYQNKKKIGKKKKYVNEIQKERHTSMPSKRDCWIKFMSTFIGKILTLVNVENLYAL